MDEVVLKMEAGLATRDILNSVVSYAERLKDKINYLAGWRVEIFIKLMKVRQDYTNLHLAQLFSCSVSTIANIVRGGSRKFRKRGPSPPHFPPNENRAFQEIQHTALWG